MEITLSMPQGIAEKVQALAEDQHTTLNTLICRAINTMLENSQEEREKLAQQFQNFAQRPQNCLSLPGYQFKRSDAYED